MSGFGTGAEKVGQGCAGIGCAICIFVVFGALLWGIIAATISSVTGGGQ